VRSVGGALALSGRPVGQGRGGGSSPRWPIIDEGVEAAASGGVLSSVRAATGGVELLYHQEEEGEAPMELENGSRTTTLTGEWRGGGASVLGLDKMKSGRGWDVE
jgi:hypothetical protein